MSRDTKRQLSWYQVDDTEAIARHLEKMAAKGWLLEGVDNWFFRYRRAEPAETRYTITFFPDASVYDPGLTDGQETYADYCRAAGWELAAAYGPLQYFRATRPDPTPIETDEAVKLTAIRRTMRKTFLLSYALLLVMPAVYVPTYLNIYRRDPIAFFSKNLQLGVLLIMAGCLLLSGGMLLDYLIWVLRSKRSVAHGGACVRPHTRFRLWLTAVVLTVCVLTLLLYFLDTSNPGLRTVLIIYLVLYSLIMLLSRWVLRKLKSRGTARGTTRGLHFAFAIVMGLVMGFGSIFLFARLAEAGIVRQSSREPVETYAYTFPSGYTHTRDVYHDDLPVTLEDLGYAVTAEDHCTYEAETDRSFLATHTECTQRPLHPDSDLPDLYYQTYETSWPWLLAWCWESLTAQEKNDPWPLQELTPAPWGATEAYQYEDLTNYILLYPDCIVTFRLSGDAAPQQLDAIAQALAPDAK